MYWTKDTRLRAVAVYKDTNLQSNQDDFDLVQGHIKYIAWFSSLHFENVEEAGGSTFYIKNNSEHLCNISVISEVKCHKPK
jgi:hypothetical protein